MFVLNVPGVRLSGDHLGWGDSPNLRLRWDVGSERRLNDCIEIKSILLLYTPSSLVYRVIGGSKSSQLQSMQARVPFCFKLAQLTVVTVDLRGYISQVVILIWKNWRMNSFFIQVFHFFSILFFIHKEKQTQKHRICKSISKMKEGHRNLYFMVQ